MKNETNSAYMKIDSSNCETPMRMDREAIKRSICSNLVHRLGSDPEHALPHEWLTAVVLAARERLSERLLRTHQIDNITHAKHVYYLSLEFLIGRLLINALMNMGIYEVTREALAEFGVDLHKIAGLELDAALGNGGLGRLAACILDAMATGCLPGSGYGIRYDYGLFWQVIENGRQIERPDPWLRHGNPWEMSRHDHSYIVRFHGKLLTQHDLDGTIHHHWDGGTSVLAVAYDYPVPGYALQIGEGSVNNLRLWSARASRELDLGEFNEGDYIGAVKQKVFSESISSILYPNDSNYVGRELRLKQEYFFVSASLQDIIAHHLKHGHDMRSFADYNAIQLNDTHPAIAVAELMRLFIDDYHVAWDEAWQITVSTFGYTNHTLMSEALESWPVEMMTNVLPRHMQIIYDINQQFLTEVQRVFPGDNDLLNRVSLIDEQDGRCVRMAHLAVLGSHRTNGVAELHSRLLKDTLFADFYRIMPERFINITNGITPRLWLHQANPALAQLITSHIGAHWIGDLTQLKRLETLSENADFRADFRKAKFTNKKALTEYINNKLQIKINPHALFDVQVKRIHEYKRQLLNLLHIITLYQSIRSGEDEGHVPRVFIFSGKAAPGYFMAKNIIRLINDVAKVVNHDPMVGDRLKCIFIPNYGVSIASLIIPAADISEQISTAGTEASGTGNMKLTLNGALTIGTLDGANIEIKDEVGDENIFIFGMSAKQVAQLYAEGYSPYHFYENNQELKGALDLIRSGFFSQDDPQRHESIVNSLLNEDHFMILADYGSYIATQKKVDQCYRDGEDWTRKAILNVARMGKFSIDRTVNEYMAQVWGVKRMAMADFN